MRKRNRFYILGIFLIFLVTTCKQESDAPPNIIIILADDLGVDLSEAKNLADEKPELASKMEETLKIVVHLKKTMYAK